MRVDILPSDTPSISFCGNTRFRTVWKIPGEPIQDYWLCVRSEQRSEALKRLKAEPLVAKYLALGAPPHFPVDKGGYRILTPDKPEEREVIAKVRKSLQTPLLDYSLGKIIRVQVRSRTYRNEKDKLCIGRELIAVIRMKDYSKDSVFRAQMLATGFVTPWVRKSGPSRFIPE